MYRDALSQLESWRVSSRRKPLLLQGARQVGKSWALKEFGRTSYANTVVIDFEEQPEFSAIFEASKDPQRILENLMFATGQPIKPGETLVIFDEIQNAPEAISSLKYFCEKAAEYHVACAGSLLGIALARPGSFPVGKVNLLNIYPMSFGEYLGATGCGNLAEYLKSIDSFESIPLPLFSQLSEKLKAYFVIGGMPEAVKCWAETQSTDEVQSILYEILELYRRDFQKHAAKTLFPKIERVWDSLPAELSRENKKFLYSLVRKGARAREYEDAVQWLSSADTVLRIHRSKEPGLPLSAYDDLDSFKLYLLDVGLLRRHSRLAPSAFSEGSRLFVEFKGALSENYVLQALRPQFEVLPRYWAQDKPRYEVDFLVQHDNDIVPVEVKAGEAVRSASLRHYRNKYGDTVKVALRFSMKNLCQDDGLINIPLFLAGEAKRLLELAI